jgi:hypothetical protein
MKIILNQNNDPGMNFNIELLWVNQNERIY